MERTKVKSSNLKSVGYDEAAKTLEIEFLNGSVYRYVGVPAETYRRFAGAESLGKAFHAFIRPKYEGEPVKPDTMPCGHPKADVVTGDEGTSFCASCEAEARRDPSKPITGPRVIRKASVRRRVTP